MIDIIGKVKFFGPKIEGKTTFELAKETILALKRYESSLEQELKRVRNQYIKLALIITGNSEVLENDNSN